MTDGTTILGIASALPERVVLNAELAERHPEWDMPRLESKTGVLERRWAGPDETSLDLGERAAVALMDQFGSSEIDALIFCTQTPDYPMPPNATLLQDRLKLACSTAAFDFTLACSGFIYGLWIGNALIQSRSARRVLLVTAETYSKVMHHGDRGPATLFGDGAAATLLGFGNGRVGKFQLGTDGGRAGAFCVPVGGARSPRKAETSVARPDGHGGFRSAEQLQMRGPQVLDFVKREIPGCVRRLLEEEGATIDNIQYVVSHQASKMSLQYLQRALHVPSQKMCDFMADTGNTVSASIPIALERSVREGRVKAGDRILLIGFGVGLSWGATIVTWGGQRG